MYGACATSIPALGILAPIDLLSGDLAGGVTVLVNNGVADDDRVLQLRDRTAQFGVARKTRR